MYAEGEAKRNWQTWKHTSQYPGRSIVIGKTLHGEVILVSILMGRHNDSRNRIMDRDLVSGAVFTMAADPSKIENPNRAEYLYYYAMRELSVGEGHKAYVVSNGDQTDTVHDAHSTARLGELLLPQSYEKDKYFTPRITGRYSVMGSEERIEFSVLRKSPWGMGCERLDFLYPEIKPGYGFCLATYKASDKTLLFPWRGEPLLIPILGTDARQIGDNIWRDLDPENRISLAVKKARPGGTSDVHIINGYESV